jgi:hypothetical protein
MPAFCRPWQEGGVGFDYRLQVGVGVWVGGNRVCLCVRYESAGRSLFNGQWSLGCVALLYSVQGIEMLLLCERLLCACLLLARWPLLTNGLRF